MVDVVPMPETREESGPGLLVRLAADASHASAWTTSDTWSSTGPLALPTLVDDDLIARVAEEFATDASWPQIVRFLVRERDLLPVLVELPQAVREAFGPRTVVALERFVDRDTVGGEQLVAIIDAPMPPAQRRRLLRSFDRSWWLARKRSTGGRVFLDSR